MVLKYSVVIVAVVAVAAAAAAAEALVARAAAPRRSVRLSSVGGASASTSGRAGGSSRRCEILLGTRTEVTMMEVNIQAPLFNIFAVNCSCLEIIPNYHND